MPRWATLQSCAMIDEAVCFPAFYFELPKNMASPMETIVTAVMSINSIITSRYPTSAYQQSA
jgi:hypothetical protein